MSTRAKHVVLVLLPRFNMMTLLTILEPMRIANYLASEDLFTWDFRAVEAGAVVASNGMESRCIALDDGGGSLDYIAVLGSWGAENFNSTTLTHWLRVHARTGSMLIGVELGIFVLARAKVLSGRTVTVHWCLKSGFAESFPKVDVCEQLYTVSKNIASCSGGTAGVDMMLQLISDAFGEALVIEISNQILHYPRRAAESPQRHAASGATSKVIHPNVRNAIKLLEDNVEEPCSIPEICEEINVSQRSLERLFVRDTGCTIVQYSKLLRLQYARELLTSTEMTVREVSVACGFNSLSYFSKCFGDMFAKKPSEYRQAWPENEDAPSWRGTVYSLVEER